MIKEKNILYLRKEIDKIDDQLFELLKKRLGISRKIGDYKRKNNLKIRDIKREKELISKRIKKSKLDRDFVHKLYNLIFNKSRKNQK